MSWIAKDGYLTDEEKNNNALEFYTYFIKKDVTLEAICGMLGNIQRECQLNPKSMETTSTQDGMGLIQWTPGTIIIDWCAGLGTEWYDGNSQCERIWCEGMGTNGAGGCWIPTTDYPYTWEQFIKLTDVHQAVYAYLKERERAGVEAVQERLDNADQWYEYLSGTPVPPTPTKKHKMPLWMMCRR